MMAIFLFYRTKDFYIFKIYYYFTIKIWGPMCLLVICNFRIFAS